jgi:hypothetical protein
VSARAALHNAKSKLRLNEKITIESILGSAMKVRAIEITKLGHYEAIVPEVRLYSRKVDPKTGKRKNLGTFDMPAHVLKASTNISLISEKSSDNCSGIVEHLVNRIRC